jgi:hypothetical protein
MLKINVNVRRLVARTLMMLSNNASDARWVEPAPR